MTVIKPGMTEKKVWDDKGLKVQNDKKKVWNDKDIAWNDKKIMKTYFVYILASHKNGTLYVGVTSNLIKRIWQHKNYIIKGFTGKYNIVNLVYYEQTTDVNEAIKREKQLKSWNREWKIKLIEEKNPEWKDLYEEII